MSAMALEQFLEGSGGRKGGWETQNIKLLWLTCGLSLAHNLR